MTCAVPFTADWLVSRSFADGRTQEERRELLAEERDRGGDVLMWALRRALPYDGDRQTKGHRSHEEGLGQLRRLLADAPLRPDGLPYYLAYPGSSREAVEPWSWALEKRKDLGARAREIVAAVACDLQGVPLGLRDRDDWTIGADDEPIDMSISAMLGLSDHRRFNESGSGELFPGQPRRAQAYVAAGRALLANVGAWPWTHVAEGRLPHDWRQRDAFLAPLAAWHAREAARTAGALEDSDRARTAVGFAPWDTSPQSNQRAQLVTHQMPA
jgi:hypothetical protein